jgi:hypothetical protein
MNETEKSKKEKEALEKGLLQFRAFDVYTRKSLINNQIIFGAAKNFNDPFDCNLPVNTNNTKPQIIEYLQLANKKSNYSSDYIENLAKHYDNDKAKLEKVIRFQVNNFRRFSCFNINSTNEVHKNSIFWANYANKHNGICMKFRGEIINAQKCFTVDSGEKIRSIPIDYNYKKIPKFNYIEYRIVKNEKGYEKAVRFMGISPSEYFFSIKSKHWRKEKEIRFVFQSINDNPILEDYINIKFNPKLLEKVYIGCNASQSTVEDVIKIMHLPKYEHVELVKLVRDNKKFKFNEERLK